MKEAHLNPTHYRFQVQPLGCRSLGPDRFGRVRESLDSPTPKTVKKETKQNGHHCTSKKSQPKKPHFCHHCGASGHTSPNRYKQLATQQSNSVSSFGSQNQLQLSLAPLRELLKVVMLLLNFNGFNSPSYPPKQRFMQRKRSSSRSPIWKEKDSKCFYPFSPLLLVCLLFYVFYVELVKFLYFLFICLLCLFVFVCLFVFCFFFVFFFVFVFFVFGLVLIKKRRKNKKNTKIVRVCVYWYLCILDGL